MPNKGRKQNLARERRGNNVPIDVGANNRRRDGQVSSYTLLLLYTSMTAPSQIACLYLIYQSLV